MRKKHFLFTSTIITGLMLLLASSALSQTPMPMRKIVKEPAAPAQSPAVKKIQQAPLHVAKIYSISIGNIMMTSKCQLRFKLKNTGANLTDDQHKNSYVKIGQNPKMSLATFDPGKRLKTKGQSTNYLENEPLTEDTNVSVEVTLFNGTKISKQKLLQPKCPDPRKALKQMTQAPTPKIKKIPAQMTVKSGDGPSGKKLTAFPTGHVTMPDTILQVERLGGDLQTWDSWAATDTSVQKMKFRWKTQIESLNMVHWQVAINANFPYVIASGGVNPIPPKGSYGTFYIDFSPFSGTFTKPATFFVRLKPVKIAMGMTPSGGGATSASSVQEYDYSTPVKITITEAGSGPTTEFHLPKRHLKVVFEKVKILDDSDDLSDGDLAFEFTVNGIKKWKDFPDNKCGTGETHSLNNLTIIATDPPEYAVVQVMGCDNDDEPGEFTGSAHCGNDPDTASGSYQIPTDKKKGRFKIPTTNFTLKAYGSSLRFEVHGYYLMYCDPCP